MKTSLTASDTKGVLLGLRNSNLAFRKKYPGDPDSRQPVHTVYGGAHLFQADTVPALGRISLAHFQMYAKDCLEFGQALGLAGSEAFPTKKGEARKYIKRFLKQKSC